MEGKSTWGNAATGNNRYAMMPDSNNATINSEVATGRRMNRRDGLMCPCSFVFSLSRLLLSLPPLRWRAWRAVHHFRARSRCDLRADDRRLLEPLGHRVGGPSRLPEDRKSTRLNSSHSQISYA